jgi:hypothetical protein
LWRGAQLKADRTSTRNLVCLLALWRGRYDSLCDRTEVLATVVVRSRLGLVSSMIVDLHLPTYWLCTVVQIFFLLLQKADTYYQRHGSPTSYESVGRPRGSLDRCFLDQREAEQ